MPSHDAERLVATANEIIEKFGEQLAHDPKQRELVPQQQVELLGGLTRILSCLEDNGAFSALTAIFANHVMSGRELTLDDLRRLSLHSERFEYSSQPVPDDVLQKILARADDILEYSKALQNDFAPISPSVKSVHVPPHFDSFLEAERKILARMGAHPRTSSLLLSGLETDRNLILEMMRVRSRTTKTALQRRIRAARETCDGDIRRHRFGSQLFTSLSWIKGQLTGAVILGADIGAFVVEPELGTVSAISSVMGSIVMTAVPDAY